MKIAMPRSIDPQGRLLIPAEIRKALGIQVGETLEVTTDGNDIRIHKYSTFVPNDEQYRGFLDVLYSTVRHGAFICSAEYIYAAKGIYLPKNSSVPKELSQFIASGEETIFDLKKPIFVMPYIAEPVAASFPIRLKSPSSPDLALVILTKKGEGLTDMEIGSAKLVSATLARQLI